MHLTSILRAFYEVVGFPRILRTLTVEAAGVAVAGLPAFRPVLSLQEWAGRPLHRYFWLPLLSDPLRVAAAPQVGQVMVQFPRLVPPPQGGEHKSPSW